MRDRIKIEYAILAAILLNPQELQKVRRALRPEMFKGIFHKEIIEAMYVCLDNGVK